MKQLLNICIVTQEYPPYSNWGGIAIYYQKLTKGLVAYGHSVVVLTRFTKQSPRFEQANEKIKIYRIGLPSWTKYLFGRTIDKLLFAQFVVKKINNLDKTKRFDIIETTEVYLEGKILVNDRKYYDRTIIQCHGSNIIGVVPKGIFSFIHKLDFKWSFRHELKILRKSKMILVPSKFGKKFLLENDIPEDKITVIYHGINTDSFLPGNNDHKINTLEVVFVGKLHKMKGSEFIWKVIERIGPNHGVRFHIVGKIHTSEKRNAEKYLEKYPEFVIYHPPLDHSAMPMLYQSMDVLLQPSYSEHFGLVFAESMACGLIVFAGKHGGGSEIIEDKVTGFLIDPNKDHEFVIHKLKEILNDNNSFKSMRQKAIKSINEKYSEYKSINQKIEYYYKNKN